MDVPTLGPFSIYIVISDSMAPYMRVNDAVIVRKTEPSALKKEDIITFRAFESDAVITHRITGVADDGGQLEFSTKGDNNNTPDSFTTPGSRVIGKVMFKIPQLATFLSISEKKPYMIVVLVVVIIGIQLLFGFIEQKLKQDEQTIEHSADSTSL